jgi:ribA/ribD-fused uncharacterized protein
MNRRERLKSDGETHPILFYKAQNDWGAFSNFSDHSVILQHPFTGAWMEYPTGEHRYQAMKADNHEDHDYVIEVDNAGAAQRRGHQVSLRKGWGDDKFDLCWYVMLEVIEAKYIQHYDIRQILDFTHDRHIYEDSPTDDIWGWRYQYNYEGKNLLGECWMITRDKMALI